MDYYNSVDEMVALIKLLICLPSLMFYCVSFNLVVCCLLCVLSKCFCSILKLFTN